jgi:hypothetical protein
MDMEGFWLQLSDKFRIRAVIFIFSEEILEPSERTRLDFLSIPAYIEIYNSSRPLRAFHKKPGKSSHRVFFSNRTEVGHRSIWRKPLIGLLLAITLVLGLVITLLLGWRVLGLVITRLLLGRRVIGLLLGLRVIGLRLIWHSRSSVSLPGYRTSGRAQQPADGRTLPRVIVIGGGPYAGPQGRAHTCTG